MKYNLATLVLKSKKVQPLPECDLVVHVSIHTCVCNHVAEFD